MHHIHMWTPLEGEGCEDHDDYDEDKERGSNEKYDERNDIVNTLTNQSHLSPKGLKDPQIKMNFQEYLAKEEYIEQTQYVQH